MEGEGIGENSYCLSHSELAKKKKPSMLMSWKLKRELRKTHLCLKMLFNMII